MVLKFKLLRKKHHHRLNVSIIPHLHSNAFLGVNSGNMGKVTRINRAHNQAMQK